jgi:hypothetical protein
LKLIDKQAVSGYRGNKYASEGGRLIIIKENLPYRTIESSLSSKMASTNRESDTNQQRPAWLKKSDDFDPQGCFPNNLNNLTTSPEIQN